MNARKANETLYENNVVELNEEALTKVIGGSGSCGWEQPWGQNQDGGSCAASGQDYQSRHCHGLLGHLLHELL